MIIKSATSCLAAILLACILGRVHGVDNKTSVNKGTVDCGFYAYFNGSVCTGCPIGSYGYNCAITCQPPAYGLLCSKECDCPNASCHYIYGCNTSTSTRSTSITPEIQTDTEDVNTTKGTKGDSMSADIGDPKVEVEMFSTYDVDNDSAESKNCAAQCKSGWWYGAKCSLSSLNGKYGNNNNAKGVNYGTFRGMSYSLKSSVIKLRRS